MCTCGILGSEIVRLSVEESQLWPFLLEAPSADLSAGVEGSLSPCHFIIRVSPVLWNSGPVQVAHSKLVASCSKTSASSRGRSCSLALNYSFESISLKVEFIKTKRMEKNTSHSVSEINRTGRKGCCCTRGSPNCLDLFLRNKSWTVRLLPPLKFTWERVLHFLFLTLGYSCLYHSVVQAIKVNIGASCMNE